MGYMIELNTLVRLPEDFDRASLKIGSVYKITRPRERTFPLHIAMLLVDDNLNFMGYCSVESVTLKDQESNITFKVISIFKEREREIYKRRFLEATGVTKEFAKK